jgi:hypothetical protein
MAIGKRTITGLLVTLAIALVVFYFASAFPADDKTSLRGNAFENNNDTEDISEDTGTMTDTLAPSSTNSDYQDTSTEEPTVEVGEFLATKEEDTIPPSGTATEISYEDFDWDDLPEFVLEAAITLGYDKELWNEEDSFLWTERKWDDLNKREKEAAKVIGWNQNYWNQMIFDNPGTQLPTSTSTSFPFFYAKFDWEELPAPIRSSAEYLGYNEAIWDECTALPLLNTKWQDLTDPQREAAESLGYDEGSWDDATRK